MRRTVCDFGPDPFGAFVRLILEGSKSGGYHLVRTFRSDISAAYRRFCLSPSFGDEVDIKILWRSHKDEVA